MPPAGFEPTILAGERPQTSALDRAATGTGAYTRRPIAVQFKIQRYVNLLKLHPVFELHEEGC